MKLKDELKRLLKERDMTAAQLARKTGISKSVICDWLAGSSPKNLHQIRNVASVFDICVDKLCFGNELTNCKNCQDCAPHLNDLISEGEWVTNLFEVKVRRIKKPKINRPC